MDWGMLDYVGFVLMSTAGILFLVIPIHESIHYLMARSFGAQPVMHIGVGWGYVIASPPTRFATLCIGASPMINEALWGPMFLRRSLARAAPLSLGLGLAFTFNFISSLINAGESDFWHLSAIGYGPLVLEIAGLAAILGFVVAEVGVRLFRPRAAV
jgi:hypothetical protein